MINVIIGLLILSVVALGGFMWATNMRITVVRNGLGEVIEDFAKTLTKTISDNNSFFKEYVNDRFDKLSVASKQITSHKHKYKLHAPAKYTLEECLTELKLGRNKEDQENIDKFIEYIQPNKETTWFERLLIERGELYAKIKKLESMIESSDTFQKLSKTKQMYLKRQLGNMIAYLNTLDLRIDYENKIGETPLERLVDKTI